jgi:hypothetical protein
MTHPQSQPLPWTAVVEATDPPPALTESLTALGALDNPYLLGAEVTPAEDEQTRLMSRLVSLREAPDEAMFKGMLASAGVQGRAWATAPDGETISAWVFEHGGLIFDDRRALRDFASPRAWGRSCATVLRMCGFVWLGEFAHWDNTLLFPDRQEP